MITSSYLSSSGDIMKLAKISEKAKGRNKVFVITGESIFWTLIPLGYWDACVQNRHYWNLVSNLQINDKDNNELIDMLLEADKSHDDARMENDPNSRNLMRCLDYPDKIVAEFLKLRLLQKWSIKSIKATLQISDDDIKNIV